MSGRVSADPVAMYLVMIGPPGAGKGTQAERVARERGLSKISTGDMLREAIQQGTELGRRARAIVERGDLVSDEVMIGVVRERLARADAARGFVLDGFPRTVAQARALDSMLADCGSLVVVEIVVPEAELVRRMCARRICAACELMAEANAPSFGRVRVFPSSPSTSSKGMAKWVWFLVT